jgi:hypothetical protein
MLTDLPLGVNYMERRKTERKQRKYSISKFIRVCLKNEIFSDFSFLRSAPIYNIYTYILR